MLLAALPIRSPQSTPLRFDLLEAVLKERGFRFSFGELQCPAVGFRSIRIHCFPTVGIGFCRIPISDPRVNERATI